MKKVALLSILFAASLFSNEIQLQQGELAKLGKKIFLRECSGKKELLLHWNDGEDFPSLGIGHFIWYPANKRGPFTETFPDLINFLIKEKKVSVPTWLQQAIKNGCPWHNKQAFLQEPDKAKLASLQDLLEKTLEQQAEFIVRRFNDTIDSLFSTLNKNQKQRAQKNYQCLSKSTQGLFALIDYHHFKGAGTNSNERYQGRGWGLLQVLLAMDENKSASDCIEEFITQAKKILIERVALSPQEKNEKRWLQGWLARVDDYRKPM